MSFCDTLCCINTAECTSAGTIPVNLSGYHKVCEIHAYSFESNFLECRICKSIILLLLCEICNTGLMHQRFGCEHLFCLTCSRESYCTKCYYYCTNCNTSTTPELLECNHYGCRLCYFTAGCTECNNSECINCNELSKKITLFCGHQGCMHCELGYCSNCLKYFNCCQQCQNFPEYLALKICKHPACWHDSEKEICRYCNTEMIQEKCIQCHNIDFLYIPYKLFFEKKIDENKKLCWSCIYKNNETDYSISNDASYNNTSFGTEEPKKEVENYDNPETQDLVSYGIYSTYHNSHSHDQYSYKCKICKTTEDLYTVDNDIYCSSCYSKKNMHKCENCQKCVEVYRLECSHCICTACMIDNNCSICISNKGYPKLSRQKCPNCSINSILETLECNHQGCQQCKYEKNCRNCKKIQNSCINCNKTSVQNAKFKCNHKACYDCIIKYCEKCDLDPTIEECSRCRSKKYLVLDSKIDACNHNSCYNCISLVKKCLICEGTFTRSNPPAQDGNSVKTVDRTVDQGYFRTPKKSSECPNCKIKTDNLCTLDCSHEGCFACVNNMMCGTCIESKKICTNCLKPRQSEYSFSCGHIPCSYCLGNDCRLCPDTFKKKICSKCDKPNTICERILKNKICNHESCYKCLKLPCKLCEAAKKQDIEQKAKEKKSSINKKAAFNTGQNISSKESIKSNNLEEKRDTNIKISTGTAPDKDSKFEEDKKQENSSKEVLEDEKCNKCKNLTQNTKKLNCGHVFCTHCFDSYNGAVNCPLGCIFTTCNFCKNVRICVFSQNKNRSGLFCLNCQNQKHNSKTICIKCDINADCILLSCNHYHCLNCYKTRGSKCMYCFSLKVPCLTCFTKGQIKAANFVCSHIQCKSCYLFENYSCLNCTFHSKTTRPYQQIPKNCIRCKTKTTAYFRLLCRHPICYDCSKLNWRLMNYKCINCIQFNKENDLCIYCFNILDVSVYMNEITKNCCNRSLPANLYSKSN